MKILALNCGSSSIKFKLYEEMTALTEGTAERIGLEGSFLKYTTETGKKIITKELKSHTAALREIMHIIAKHSLVEDITDIKAVGHRVVHGGEAFTKSIIIDKNVEAKIQELIPLSPLHNPANLSGIKAAKHFLKDAIHVAVFDTAFHQSIPEEVYRYAVPWEWYDRYKVRKYGFHGTSHLYVSKRAAVLLGKHASECDLITMHIGNGVSCAAIKNGMSVDTSMGMTPLDGAIMGTRTGEIDPAVSFYILDHTDYAPHEVYDIMNTESGLMGITGGYSDRRDIISQAKKGDALCTLALKMEGHRLKQYIGSYLAILGRADAIVFTAGVGENSAYIRALAVEGLEEFGIELDKEKNHTVSSASGEQLISTTNSKIKIFMIPTNEEQVLLEDVMGVLDGSYSDHMHHKYSFA